MDRLVSIGLGAAMVLLVVCLVQSCTCTTCGPKTYTPSRAATPTCNSGWTTEFAGVRKEGGVAWKIKPC